MGRRALGGLAVSGSGAFFSAATGAGGAATCSAGGGAVIVTNEFFLLRVHRHCGVACRQLLHRLRVDVLELFVSVPVLRAFRRLAVPLQAVLQRFQQASDGSVAHTHRAGGPSDIPNIRCKAKLRDGTSSPDLGSAPLHGSGQGAAKGGRKTRVWSPRSEPSARSNTSAG